MTARLPTNLATARLPDSYIKARAALRTCARKFSPERYAKAVVALGGMRGRSMKSQHGRTKWRNWQPTPGSVTMMTS
jgi:hypothetical protein